MCNPANQPSPSPAVAILVCHGRTALFTISAGLITSFTHLDDCALTDVATVMVLDAPHSAACGGPLIIQVIHAGHRRGDEEDTCRLHSLRCNVFNRPLRLSSASRRSDTVELRIASSVFLDKFHMRRTDLQLPCNYGMARILGVKSSTIREDGRLHLTHKGTLCSASL